MNFVGAILDFFYMPEFLRKLSEVSYMFLQLKDSGDLVKILDIEELLDPNNDVIHGRGQVGEEEQEPDAFKKGNLVFPSGEELPRCWLDANYRKAKV